MSNITIINDSSIDAITALLFAITDTMSDEQRKAVAATYLLMTRMGGVDAEMEITNRMKSIADK